MPLVEISALPQPEMVDIRAALERVRLAVASGLGCDAGVVWAVWREIGAGRYDAGGVTPDEQPRNSHDPIVRISAYRGRSEAAIAGTIEGVARTLAGALGLDPSNVFVV